MQLYTEFYPLLVEPQGSIIYIDSVASINPAMNNPAYSASKADLVQLTKALAKKWGHSSVRVKFSCARHGIDQDDGKSVGSRAGSTI